MGVISVAGILLIIYTVYPVQSKLRPTKYRPIDDDPNLWYGEYQKAAVQADHFQCTEIGKNILLKGGSAADAFIATAVCIGLVNSFDSGIGGGGFLVYSDDTDGSYFRINGREVAPEKSTANMFLKNQKWSKRGGKAVAVPGAIKLFKELHDRKGKLPWAELWYPSRDLAIAGYEVTYHISRKIEFAQRKGLIAKQGSNLGHLLNADGSPKQEGQLIRDTLLARTFTRIAQDPDTFYRGQLARDIVSDIRDHQGILSTADLANYSSTTETHDQFKTITLPALNLEAIVAPLPSSGYLLAFLMGVIDTYTAEGAMRDRSALTYHRLVELWKFGYGYRSRLGDPRFVAGAEKIRTVLADEATWRQTRQRINDAATNQTFAHYGDGFAPKTAGTSHMAVMFENVSIAATMSVNTPWAAGFRGKRTGIIFNNHMDDFSTPGQVNTFGFSASPSNYIVPGKQMMSSMCPTIFKRNGKNYLISGGSGGSWITSGTSMVALNLLNLGLPLSEAVANDRLHHQLAPMEIKYHDGFNASILKDLQERGHAVKKRSYYDGSNPTVWRPQPDRIEAKGDNRKPGSMPAGF